MGDDYSPDESGGSTPPLFFAFGKKSNRFSQLCKSRRGSSLNSSIITALGSGTSVAVGGDK